MKVKPVVASGEPSENQRFRHFDIDFDVTNLKGKR